MTRTTTAATLAPAPLGPVVSAVEAAARTGLATTGSSLLRLLADARPACLDGAWRRVDLGAVFTVPATWHPDASVLVVEQGVL